MNNPTLIFILAIGFALICIFAVGHYFTSTSRKTRRNRGSIFALLLIPAFAQAQPAPPPVPEGRYIVQYTVWIGGQFITSQEEECIVRPWNGQITTMECEKGYIRRDMRAVPNALLILDTPFIEVGPGQFRWTTKEGGVEYKFKLPGKPL